MDAGTIALVVCAVYLAATLVTGVAPGLKAAKSVEGFVAASRSMGPVLLYFVLGASIFSAFAFLGGPGWAYSRGAAALYILGYGALGMVPLYFFGPRARRLGERFGFVTQAELLARVRAVLRRAQPPTEVGQTRFFTHDNLKIDFARAEVWRGEQAVSLSATEYRLLLQFAHHVGKIMTSEELLSSVWGPEYRSDKEILWVSIARLRQKLEEDAHTPKHIVTRSGLGYLMPPIED